MYDVVDAAALRNAVSALNAGDFVLPDGQLLVVKVFLGNVGLESEARQEKNAERAYYRQRRKSAAKVYCR